MNHSAVRKKIWTYYHKYGRHTLPWRTDISSYSIVVSEIMLQQTQVDRVVPKYQAWMAALPDWQTLAKAPLRTVLSLWQGLGYNSRAKRLQQCAQLMIVNHDGVLPSGREDLLTLPGIGPYTAGAIMAFAYNTYTDFIETNIRRVILYHYFTDANDVSDKQVKETLGKLSPKRFVKNKSVRHWYWALMDYGAHLGKVNKANNPNKRSRHYIKQSTFKGSDRQIRGQLLRTILARQPIAVRDVIADAASACDADPQRVDGILQQLANERLCVIDKKVVTIS